MIADYRTLHKQKNLLKELLGKRLLIGCHRRESCTEHMSCSSLVIEPDSGRPLLLRMAPDKAQPYYERMKIIPLPPSKHISSKLELLDLRTHGLVEEISVHYWEQSVTPETYILDGFISITLQDKTEINILRGEMEHPGDILVTNDTQVSEILGYATLPQFILKREI